MNLTKKSEGGTMANQSSTTDYSSEHKAWQQRVEKEMYNQNK